MGAKSAFAVLCTILVVMLWTLVSQPDNKWLGFPIAIIAVLVVMLPYFGNVTRAVIGKSGLTLEKRVEGLEVDRDALFAKQREQDQYLNQYRFFCILANLLSYPEKHHLRYLRRRDGGAPSEQFIGRPEFRDEIFRLKRFGLLNEQTGQKIGLMYDGTSFDPYFFVKLTDLGASFVELLPNIED